MNIHLAWIVGRVVRRSALAVALVAALVGMSRSASALSMQPGDVAKLSYDFSPSLQPGDTTNGASAVHMSVIFGSDGLWQVNTSFAYQFFNSDGTAISSAQKITESLAPSISQATLGLIPTIFDQRALINPSGFLLLTSLDATFDLTAAVVRPVFGMELNGVSASISSVSTSVSATPLPSTWGMMLTGLGLVAYLAFRRRESGGVLAAA